MKTADEIVNGLFRYVDAEVMPRLDTKSKIIVGTLLGMSRQKAEVLSEELTTNSTAQLIGAVDDDGMIDDDLILEHLKKASDKYGKMEFQIPLAGTIAFDGDDVNDIKFYINGGIRK